MVIIPWLIVVGSSIWVLIDAKAIGVKMGQIKGIANNGPVGWFIVCLLLWIIGFPLYLAKRGVYKRINGKEGGSTVATVLGLVLIAVQVLVIIMTLTGGIKMTTSDLQKEVRKSIEGTLAKEPAFASAKVLSFGLIHKTGNQYEGLLEFSVNGTAEKHAVDVTYDGKQYIWQIRK